MSPRRITATPDPSLVKRLRAAEGAYRKAADRAEAWRQERNELVLQAFDREGWTLQQIADATGLSRGRVSQITSSKQPELID